jgi:hypothetical protein
MQSNLHRYIARNITFPGSIDRTTDLAVSRGHERCLHLRGGERRRRHRPGKLIDGIGGRRAAACGSPASAVRQLSGIQPLRSGSHRWGYSSSRRQRCVVRCRLIEDSHTGRVRVGQGPSCGVRLPGRLGGGPGSVVGTGRAPARPPACARAGGGPRRLLGGPDACFDGRSVSPRSACRQHAHANTCQQPGSVYRGTHAWRCSNSRTEPCVSDAQTRSSSTS